MESIFDNKEYTKHHFPPYIPGKPYGQRNDTVVFWYLYTPTGKVSKFWYYVNSAIEHDPEKLATKYTSAAEFCFRKQIKSGYRLSKAYLYHE